MRPLLATVRSTAARAWAAGFAAALLTDLAAITFGIDEARWVAKPALMLLLLGYLGASAPPGRSLARPLGIALLLAWAADIALLVEGTPAFLTGMALFGAMQLGYLRVFARLGALRRLRRRWAAPAAYSVLWAGAVAALWPRLDSLAAPVAVYGLLLAAMGALAAGVGRWAALGGALFVVSDLMLGMGVAGIDFPLRGQAVMAAYGAAQFLIVLGCLRNPGFGAASEE